ncbi:MAG: T9SS type A sorting domain-containing protein [Bacteroidetes bacterium]|nr:T9SS type A sorting domain-containing protein [Bacteroidota bacterium]
MSNKKKNYLIKTALGLLFFIITIVSVGQPPSIQWQKSFGGTGSDIANSVKQTKDGGYIVAGATTSSDGDVIGFHGSVDYWIIKTDASGNVQWQKCLGGSRPEGAQAIQQTTDGGYIVAGATESVNGDVTGRTDSLQFDCWIVKLDSLGNIQWQKSYGGTKSESAYAIQQTIDGGYVFAGNTNSNDGDVSGNHIGGKNDYWVVKINSIGGIQWQKCLGGTNTDDAFSIQPTTDKGFIVAGRATSNDGDVTGHQGSTFSHNYWVVKLDSSGAIQWQKSLGGTNGTSEAWSVQQTINGEYVVAGVTTSIDGDVSCNFGAVGSSVCWLIKLSSAGTVQWKQCYGGGGGAIAYSVTLNKGGGFFISGFAGANGGDITGNHGGSDYWILKLDSIGTIVWKQCYGGTNNEGVLGYPVVLEPTNDEGCIVAGSSQSNDGDVTGNHGDYDYWIVKLASTTGVEMMTGNNLELKAYPNPNNGNFIIETNSQKEQLLRIFDVTGQLVLTEAIQSGKTIINASSLAHGVYNASISNDEQKINKPLVIVR